MSEWDALSDYDRSWALGADVADLEDAKERCPQCGGMASECQDTDNQHAYEVTWRRCYRTAAIREAEKARKDHVGVMAVAVLNPAKKKSARKKG